MKNALFLLAVVPLVFFVTWDAHGLIIGHPLEFWDDADIILDGTVISTTKIESEQLVEHNIKVEQYFKNPKPQQMITVYGPDIYNEDWFYPKFFNEGERALFYLKKVDEKYIILPHSILATEKCSPRDMIGLSTLPGEPIGRGGPTLFFDPYQTCNGFLYPAWYLASSLTPLKQFEAGIKTEDIECNNDFFLVLKASNGKPACVTPQTAKKLFNRNVVTSGVSLDHGLKLFDDGNYEKAMRVFDQILMLEPDHVEALKLAGDTMVKRGHEGTSALYYYKRWLELEPENIDAMLATARAYQNMGSTLKSRELFGQVLFLDEKNTEALDAISEYNKNVVYGAFTIKDTPYKIEYSIFQGKVIDIVPSVSSKSLIIKIETKGNGDLAVTIPRDFFDKNRQKSGDPDLLFVLVDGAEVEYEETITSQFRGLRIPFEDGATEIEIITSYAI